MKKHIIILIVMIGICIEVLSGCMASSSPEEELYDMISDNLYERYSYTWSKLGGDFRVENFDDATIENKGDFYEVFITYGLWDDGWDSDTSDIYHVKAKKINGEWELREFTKTLSECGSFENWEKEYNKFYAGWD